MSALLEHHNRAAGELVWHIVMGPREVGGTFADSLILLESVIAGTVVALSKLGSDENVFDLLMERVRVRIAELRLGDIEPEGSA